VVEWAEHPPSFVPRAIRREIRLMIAPRLPANRLLSRHAAADARLHRQDGGDGGPGRRASVTLTAPRDRWRSFGPTRAPVGDRATMRVGGVRVVPIRDRTQVLRPELFRDLGIEPTDQRPRVVRPTNQRRRVRSRRR
jgi:microcystin degradation protein MlrC